jgi:two-component system cell cycle response regulator DivK
MTPDAESLSVLVVEDNPLNAKLTRLVLQQEGCRVETAPNAAQALEILSRIKPRVILMDLQLPGMDGFELTWQIKHDPALQGVLVIALTAYAMKGDKDRAFAAGCDGYIPKPIETRALMGQILACLAKHDERAGSADASGADRSSQNTE